MKEEKGIAVVYLMWLPAGIEKFYTFINSYLQNSPGITHQVIIIFKDFGSNTTLIAPYHSFLKEKFINYKALYFEGGLDIDTYFFAAQNISAELFLFLNTNSVLLSENWLKKMYDNIMKENIAMVSASGSWQSYSSMGFMMYPWHYEFKKSLRHNFRKYKLFIKSALYYKLFFKGFPNPHLRTNGFMIWRDIFLSIRYKPLSSKMRAYQFESGRNSITNQIFKKNKKVLVVDKFGIGYEIKNWYGSKTFWENDQENLMISDNQTTKYINADETEKKLYTYLAWGKK